MATKKKTTNNPCTMKVILSTNSGGGFAEEYTVLQGTSLDEFLRERGVDMDRSIATVNRDIATRNQELSPGDRINVAPKDIKGN